MTLLNEDGPRLSETENESYEPSQQAQSSATAFRPFGTISLFNYLTPLSDRTDWYRAIMRTFFQSSRAYRYQLTAQDVLEAVHAEIREPYHLEACKTDLERMVKWGNLATLYDAGRVTTIADFRSPVLRYQATSEALEIEAFLASHAHIGASEGGLRQGDLPLLWETLQQIHRWLQEGHRTLTPERRQEIVETWHTAFTTWEQVTNDAAQYLGSMNQSAQQTVNLAAFLSYKNIVVNYIQSFAQQLVHYSNAIRTLFVGWSQTEKKALLLEIILSTPPPIQTLAENLDIWHEDVQRQIEALEDWFVQESNVDMFLSAASEAMHKVVHRAHSLAFSMRPQTDYVSMLQTLACQLMQVKDLETAQHLYASAFASATPIHLPEGFVGSPVVAETPTERTTWQSPPTVTRSLRPIYKGNVERTSEPPMRHQEEAIYQIKQQHDAEIATQQQRFDRLFQAALLDLGTIKTIAPQEREALIEVIDGCLCNPALEYSLPDGSLISLLNRHEADYIALRSYDGVLLLPRYRLQRQHQPARQTARAKG